MYDRIYFPAKGFGGGLPGEKGHIYLNDGTKPHPKTKYMLKPDQKITLELPGGGGFFPPDTREPEMVREDVIDGLVSIEQAKEVYRVAIDPSTLQVDNEKTSTLRNISTEE
jgi:N-methylhydantoinase B